MKNTVSYKRELTVIPVGLMFLDTAKLFSHGDIRGQ